MKNIVLYAPPAAGKGTQCEFLSKKYGYEVLSIGQVLRNNRSNDTEIGRIIIETQDKGILTPDDIVAEALKTELTKYKDKNIVLDGYPRNIEQAKSLDHILSDYIVINLAIDRKIAEKRTLGRIICTNCKKNFNIYFEEQMPKQENICDDCGAKLEKRSDDNEESFNVRFDVYEENAPTIIDYYKKKNNLFIIDSGISKENTQKEIEKIISRENND